MKLWNRWMCYCRRRSPWLFHMNSGSCNGCDIELVASLTPRYDAEQLGVRLEGSPRHADILCITGPVTRKAVNAVKTVYDQVCGPKAVVAIGSCPATTNVFVDSRTLEGPLNRHIPVDVFVPGCPPRPDAIIAGVARAAGILAERSANATAGPSTSVAAATSAQDDKHLGVQDDKHLRDNNRVRAQDDKHLGVQDDKHLRDNNRVRAQDDDVKEQEVRA